MNQRDITAEVLLRRNAELRKQRDAAVKDNQRLRMFPDLYRRWPSQPRIFS